MRGSKEGTCTRQILVPHWSWDRHALRRMSHGNVFRGLQRGSHGTEAQELSRPVEGAGDTDEVMGSGSKPPDQADASAASSGCSKDVSSGRY